MALTIQPDRPLGHLCRAGVLSALGRAEEALVDLDRAVELAPDEPRLLFERAYELRRSGRYEAALADYTKCLELAPDRPEHAYCNRGLVHGQLSQFDPALADFERGIAVASPPSGFCHYERARVLRWMGRYAEALADHDRAQEIEPDHADMRAGRGVTRWLAGDLAGAAADIEEALALDPEDKDAAFKLVWLWQIHLALQDHKLAAAKLEAARSAANEWQSQLVAYLQGQRTENAILAECADAGMRCEAYYYLGAKALVQGREADASKWFQECVALRFHNYVEHDLALGMLASISNAAQ